MIPTFRAPLLAASLMPSDIEHSNSNILEAMQKLRYPVIATRKVDGVRGLRFNHTLLSRSLKKIPNLVVQEMATILPGGFDVEICNDLLPYNENESIIMSEEHEHSALMQFHVLDWYIEGEYAHRLQMIDDAMRELPSSHVKFDMGYWCNTAEELMQFFLEIECEDGEGICFRVPGSRYVQKKSKENRSTLTEQILVKLSRFIREEAIIVGFDEQMCNTNPDGFDAFGKIKRSKAIGGMKGKGTLGALVCSVGSDVCTGRLCEIRIATGLTDQQRYNIWTHKKDFFGKTIVFKHKPYGKKNKHRSPIFVGFRKDI